MQTVDKGEKSGLFLLDQGRGTGELEKPSGVAEGNNGAKQTLVVGGSADKVYQCHGQTVNFKSGDCRGQLSLTVGSQLKLTAPAIHIG